MFVITLALFFWNLSSFSTSILRQWKVLGYSSCLFRYNGNPNSKRILGIESFYVDVSILGNFFFLVCCHRHVVSMTDTRFSKIHYIHGGYKCASLVKYIFSQQGDGEGKAVKLS